MRLSLMADTPPLTPSSEPRRRRRGPKPVWAGWPDEKLLDVRICDLGLTIEGTPLERQIAEVNQELDARGIVFRAHYWLSDDWFTPNGVPGIAIPFYLAHPRLARLELSQMLEVEGGTRAWCMRILRHEIGHAIDNAYGFSAGGGGKNCLENRRRPTQRSTSPSRTARALSCTSTPGTHRAIPMRTSQRRSRYG